MTLKLSTSDQAFRQNIRTERKANPQQSIAQDVAIAYSEKRKAQKMKRGKR